MGNILGNQFTYREASEKHTNLQQEMESYDVVETTLQEEMRQIDELIARKDGVVDRFKPLYTAGDRVPGAKDQKSRIEQSLRYQNTVGGCQTMDVKPPWTVATVHGAAKVQKTLPADGLERQERNEMMMILDEMHREMLRAKQEAIDRDRAYQEEMAPRIGNGDAAPSA